MNIALLRVGGRISLCSSRNPCCIEHMQAVENKEVWLDDEVGRSFVARIGDEVRNVRIQGVVFLYRVQAAGDPLLLPTTDV
jgi:hypothetical protein